MIKNHFFLLALFSVSGLGVGEEQKEISWESLREEGKKRSSYLKGEEESKVLKVLGTKPDLEGFKDVMQPIFKSNCINCHGPKKSKGGFRVDELSGDLLHGPHINEWLDIYEVLSNEEMPPDDKPKYAIKDSVRGDMIDWIGLEMKKAAEARKNEAGHSSFRRMTKYEYNYALQDLLGLPYNFAADLPPESTSEDGFKNSSQLLQMSAMQFEAYRNIGLRALLKATVRGDQPEPVNFVLSMEELALKGSEQERQRLAEEAKQAAENKEKEEKDQKKGDKKKKKKKKKRGPEMSILNYALKKNVKTENWGWSFDRKDLTMPSPSSNVYVLHGGKNLKLNMENRLPDEGIMRIRVRAGIEGKMANQYSSLRIGISAQTSNNANFSATISHRDMPVSSPHTEPEVIEFFIPLSEIPRNPLKNEKGKGRMVNEFISIYHISNGGSHGQKVYLDYLDISGPFYEEWPPKSHRRLFPKYSEADEYLRGKNSLVSFMTKAWRRPVTEPELEKFMGLYETYRPEFNNMEDAMLEVMATVLATPDFLYINRESRREEKQPQKVSDLDLASRLSFFLWSSIPDEELIDLAKANRLSETETLRAQVHRMLQDDRADRFSLNFVEQWLGLDGIDNISVDRKTHGPYSSSLKEASLHEPIAHFNEVLSKNLSVLDFIQSDYVMINQTLAHHYGISEVHGPHFRRVELNDKTQRGGLMTTAGVMTVNSDGKDSHPLKRGVWILERFLNDPPPPPPPNVPEVDLTDPEILKMTLKERMADHRNNPACLSCHQKIDPWGIAFENYNALGKFRTEIKGKDVDATSELHNKQKLAGALGLKSYLLTERQDQFVRAIVHKMVSYALGRHLSFKDNQAVDALASEFRKKDDRLKDLVSLIITSDLFMMN